MRRKRVFDVWALMLGSQYATTVRNDLIYGVSTEQSRDVRKGFVKIVRPLGSSGQGRIDDSDGR